MKSPREAPQSPIQERRSGQDRRRHDLPPPTGIERRRSIEARKPEVRELEMTDTEWGQLLDSHE
ncbi:hypothetical protein [Caldimonas sp. KR1-144]|uniref:hypothetical protein n=1 Tax=Caldimonas sp. KR1-144 TaxID=3400911 RepID=UPI003C0729AC